MTTLHELKQQGYILCLPQKIHLDTGLIGKLICNLCCNSSVSQSLKAVPAKIFLSRNWLAVDDNGDIISSLDTDIDRKLVIAEDINLYFALQQSRVPESDILIDMLKDIPRGKKWNF